MRLQSSLIILLTALLSLPLSAQIDAPAPPPPPQEEIFRVVEEMPRFPGCEEKVDRQERQQCAQGNLLRYVYEHLKYPEAAKAGGKEGMAVVSFVVQPDGSLANIKVMRDPGLGMGPAAANVLHQMNEEEIRWIPGKQRGQAVPVNFNLPVRFRLSQEDKARMSMDMDEEITRDDIAIEVEEDSPQRPARSRPDRVAEPPPPPPPPMVEMEPEPVVDAPIEDEGIEEDVSIELDREIEMVAPPPPPPPPPPQEVEEVFVVVENMPRFYSSSCETENATHSSRKNCAQEAMLRFIYSNLQYPAEAKTAGVEGTCVVRFIVEKDGSLSDIAVTRDIGAGCGEEVTRVVGMMASPGQWVCGTQRGRAVRVKFNLPVKFRL